MRSLAIPAILVVFVLVHLIGIDAAPNGFHLWRESDTATVAENFATESMDFLAPRVNARGVGPGVVGMELPIYTYATAVAYKAFGFSHVWPRLLSLLGATLGLWLLSRIYLRLAPGQDLAATLGVLLAASSPFFAFYSVKIQPDVWGVLLTLGGFLAFLRWRVSAQWRDFTLCALALALAGGIKPTFLFVGLPMVGVLVGERDGWRTLARPRMLLLAAMILAPVALWFRHARAMNARFGQEYFFVGGDMLGELRGLLSAQFYQNTLLTWPFEMAVGLPAVAFLATAVWTLKGGASRRVAFLWLCGCAVTWVLSAQHCATPHDYYYLATVPMLAWLAGQGAAHWLRSSRRTARIAAVCLVSAAPAWGVARVDQRFDFSTHFAEGRNAVDVAVPREARVIAVDKTPGAVLYRAGRKGWRVGPDFRVVDLRAAFRDGGRYVLIASKDWPLLSDEQRGWLSQPLAAGGGLSVHVLSRAGERLMDLEGERLVEAVGRHVRDDATAQPVAE